jgi:hypothetical protein
MLRQLEASSRADAVATSTESTGADSMRVLRAAVTPVIR